MGVTSVFLTETNSPFDMIISPTIPNNEALRTENDFFNTYDKQPNHSPAFA